MNIFEFSKVEVDMWADNETERDFLNFSGIADTVAEIIAQANGRPVSIGVSGSWGVGKSSMIKLTHASLSARPRQEGDREFVVVEFNAWLYQGYDDARAALMDVIADKLAEEAKKRETAGDKVTEFVKRIRWLRLGKLVATDVAALTLGLPPIGVLGGVFNTAGDMADGVNEDELKAADKAVKKAGKEVAGLLDPRLEISPPKEIQALRNSFEQALEELGITLVVLIDDLDRCLPPTTISTLEAIRLFLFLRHTAFVIAADDGMIKHAVRRHFDGITDDLVINYFDKLIQVPIRVPPLGTQEVRAYMMLLFVDNSSLDQEDKNKIRLGVCEQLRKTWQGNRVDRGFVAGLHPDLPGELVGKLDTADRLAPLMVGASGILGNPRLIKRFLNALSIRMAISNAQGVGVDEAVLAKLMLFERLGDSKAFADLVSKVSTSDNGKPAFLAEWEKSAIAGAEFALQDPWKAPFIEEWLRLPPALSDIDLRGALYVSREHAPLISPEDRLSSDAAEVLTALLTQPEMAGSLKARLSGLARAETTVLMDRVLEKARQEQEWGVPAILESAVALAESDSALGARLAAFLRDRPVAQIRPNIIPRIADYSWAKDVFGAWDAGDTSKPVKAAIKTRTVK
ncbi:P-loop NTPase fold protein [Xanthomonas arboricola pv. juglandis]|uniref:KAP family P-loop NTPase fold protein n=1 Tax=Xanthomonas arboricola TaxID=56448 RepID=UPI001B80631F|nr:P-loop NTPase fold protein [Xanthomonas arboricola]MDN0243719.1 P-loop NTPase fold protein [Xanthomonas arboricola pv. juglandis]MDN0256281.1 P-loop NTPase fold protein [Xanthomonas arboricola pv. juglandis]MDN0260349.1 P-loop NTPase fold protein [Xanthomonas arboricola pv. juglandis]MDN0264424.1 P-loop NTPase fold protein [Xanthomonas arboricola pv. juglandis]